jgi:sugar lactone lactonase YvrE
LAACLLLAGEASAATSEFHVIGLGALTDGRLVVLDRDRGLLLVSLKDHSMRALPVDFGLQSPMDLATVQAATDQILVTVRLRSASSRQGRLLRYDSSGRLSGQWLAAVGEELSGVTVEAGGRFAYVTSFRQPVVYRFDLSRPGAMASRLALLRGADSLGSIAVDVKGRRLFVADAYGSAVRKLALDSSRTEVIVDEVGEPYALAYDQTAQRLYIADAEASRVLGVDLADTVPKARPFAAAKGLGEPHALALGSDGTLWAADYRTAALFQFSRTGALLQSFRPTLVEPPARR